MVAAYPDWHYLRWRVARHLTMRRRWADAAPVWAAIEACHPDDPDAAFEHALARHHLGVDPIVAYARVAEGPRAAYARRRRVEAWIARGDHGPAATALTEQPDDGQLHRAAAFAYASRGALDEALRHGLRARALRSPDPGLEALLWSVQARRHLVGDLSRVDLLAWGPQEPLTFELAALIWALGDPDPASAAALWPCVERLPPMVFGARLARELVGRHDEAARRTLERWRAYVLADDPADAWRRASGTALADLPGLDRLVPGP